MRMKISPILIIQTNDNILECGGCDWYEYEDNFCSLFRQELMTTDDNASHLRCDECITASGR